MNQYSGFAAQKSGRRETLPPDGYVVKIMGVEEKSFSNGPCLMVSFDIAEGNNAGFFANDYRNNTFENKRWRGVHFLSVPKEDGTERDGWAVNAMNNFIAVLQESNPGFVWDWAAAAREDYSALKGRLMGVLFGRVEWKYNGETGWNTNSRAIIPVEDVRKGFFEIPADKPLNKGGSTAGPAQGSAFDSDGDLPF